MQKSFGFKNSGLIYVIIASLMFSTGGLLIKLCTWSPITINGMRSLIAAIVFYFVLKSRGHIFVFNKRTLMATAIACCMNYAFVMATKLTSAGNAVVLQFTQPVFIIILTFIIFKQRPSGAAIITCFAVFCGIICAFVDKISVDGFLGNMLALFSGFSYAMVFLFKSMEGVDFESAMLYSFITSFVICIPWFLSEPAYPAENFLFVGLLGIFQMGLAYYFLGKGLSTISAITASLTSTIEPVINPILVAVFYGESLGFLAILGGLIVVSSSTIYNIYESKKESF